MLTFLVVLLVAVLLVYVGSGADGLSPAGAFAVMVLLTAVAGAALFASF